MVGLRCCRLGFCGSILLLSLLWTHHAAGCESVIDGVDVSGGSCFDSDCTSACPSGGKIAPNVSTSTPSPLLFYRRPELFHHTLLNKFRNNFSPLAQLSNIRTQTETNKFVLVASGYIFKPQQPAAQSRLWEGD